MIKINRCLNVSSIIFPVVFCRTLHLPQVPSLSPRKIFSIHCYISIHISHDSWEDISLFSPEYSWFRIFSFFSRGGNFVISMRFLISVMFFVRKELGYPLRSIFLYEIALNLTSVFSGVFEIEITFQKQRHIYDCKLVFLVTHQFYILHQISKL